ncbi:MAG: DUF296 domain-containing protein [Deltaproteobacteria bacterium]|nr:MAG: DUF296 domain-containing protein [Deltaproteobacteria bacterium]
MDLITFLEEFCKNSGIELATFSVTGAASSVTIGTYDQNQQVYITETAVGPFEILICYGNVSQRDGNPVINAQIILADKEGKTTGGHLFSQTILYTGELVLQELQGTSLTRSYDPETGLMLW